MVVGDEFVNVRTSVETLGVANWSSPTDQEVALSVVVMVPELCASRVSIIFDVQMHWVVDTYVMTSLRVESHVNMTDRMGICVAEV
jgi:hypothetical protein